jgi:hypothetical protein
LAIMKEFGLKIFQHPSGDDVLSLSKKNELVETHTNN